ncbi:MAG: Gfo/Idh/MocA family oxidoreductase [Bacteroidetes bacterium]|nr:Gfo/Idh/MocA family oxidoreductase [Bacteroidota bacterium]
MNRKLRIAMIGGGIGAFIGSIHRIAFSMDGHYELVAGAFSANPAVSKKTGEELLLNANRVYPSFQKLIQAEALLPADVRAEVICIVTPNHVHYEPARMALEAGFHVVLEKPMTFSLEEARLLHKKVLESDSFFMLCHTYTGYPMVKQARQLIQAGLLGEIRKVFVEYPQGWLHTYLEGSKQKQADWRTDPSRSGLGGAMGDIGTHAFNLAEFISGLEVSKLCASVNTIVAGRKLDDDGAALLQFSNGASGVLMATQIAAGAENNISIRIYGEKGGISWKQEDHNSLRVEWPDRPTECWRAGTGYLSEFATQNSRTPAGHPEGYLEAFANLYRNFARTIMAKENGVTPSAIATDFPGSNEGLRGMAFVEAMIRSSQQQSWVDFIH